MARSMTAFATRQGSADSIQWLWEIRSVNGRGLDIKVRLADGFADLEPQIRAKVGKIAVRGNISLNLKLQRTQMDGGLDVDNDRLDMILEALDHVQERAFAKGVTLGQPTAADVLAQRGVLVSGQADTTDAIKGPVMEDLDAALASLRDMRESEGANLLEVLHQQVSEIETLTQAAVKAAEARADQIKQNLKTALDRILDTGTDADPNRVAQELALIAVKSDVTEEIDRLTVHIAAARDLLASDDSIGRKLDFLTQEFNREANTLCSKAGAADLTQIGLALKSVIDQMREQVQNVE